MGRLKIPYQDLFILSDSELDAIIYGHEIDIKANAEIQRAIGGLMVSPYAKSGYDVRKDIPFYWDEKEEHEPATKEDFVKAQKILDIVDELKAQRDVK